MRRLTWTIALSGCLASAGLGGLLGRLPAHEDGPAPIAEARKAPAANAQAPTLRGAPVTAHPAGAPGDPVSPADRRDEWVQSALDVASGRMGGLNELSRFIAQSRAALRGTNTSMAVQEGWVGQATAELLAHERIRQVVRDLQVPRHVLEALASALLTGSPLDGRIDPELAAAILPAHAEVWRSRGRPAALEALSVQVDSAVADPELRSLLRLQLIAAVRAPRDVTAADAPSLAAELDGEVARLLLERRMGMLEGQLDRAEDMLDASRSTCAEFLERSDHQRPLRFAVAALTDLMRGLLIAGVSEEHVLRGDFGAVFAAYEEYERQRQQIALDYERLWLGVHLERIAEMAAPSVDRRQDHPLLRELAASLRLGPDQVRALARYFAVRARRN